MISIVAVKPAKNKNGAGKAVRSPYRVHFKKVLGVGTMRWLVGGALLCLANFLWWFFTDLRMGYAPLFWLLAISIGFKILRMLHEWIHYVQVREPVPPAYTPAERTVDFLTTACPGEPHGMIIRTLEAMQEVRYPHTSYLCDEGNDPMLRAACARLGVVHVTREVKVNAKAGNINNALRQATGEFCVVLDPDHVPAPDFLDQVMPYFEDERVGFVQVVQAYGNQQESLIAAGAAQQTYHFYGPLMMGMNGYGTVQAIGANCTFRRTALDSIGGHAPGLTEDMHTAMRLHAEGWQSVYVPKVVSRGLVPASLAAFYSQQLKWSRGAFDLLFRVYPRLFGKFSWAQRLHYLLLPLYFFSGVVALIDLLLPVLSLTTSQFPWLVNLQSLALHALPLMGMSLLIRGCAQRWLREPTEGGLHLAGGFLRIGTWWVYTLGFLYAVVGKRVPYLPTPKEGRWENEWRLAIPNLLLALGLLVACWYGKRTSPGSFTDVMVLLALMNILILTAAAGMGQHQAIRNFIADMATRPFRWLVLGLDRLRVTIAGAISTVLRRFSRTLALTGLVAMSSIYYVRTAWLAQLPPEWLLNGAETVHIGSTLEPQPAAIMLPASLGSGMLSLLNAPSSDALVALTIPTPSPSSELPELVFAVASRHQVPVVSWNMTSDTLQNRASWQQLARQIRHVPGPVMLRPLLSASSAADYRRAWRQLCDVFQHEKVTNAVWAWTPEASDPQLQKFPGAAYVHWIVSPLLPDGSATTYPVLQAQLSPNLTLHQVPVLLLAPAPKRRSDQTARQLAVQYPEIRAVVFAAPNATLPKLQHATTTPKSMQGALQQLALVR
jgi:cellulose synthase (UDP-forming)